MKVVALLSGGKDSCFCLLQARLHGHELVAVAHIVPPKEEADSYMYQSVGSAAVTYIAEALNLPLFTAPTKAIAKQSKLYYTPTENDEVEDLVVLLEKVKRECVSVQAVCSGALWSDYQRLRVESACSRVGLFSLAYLWRRNQRELLDDMIRVGLEAVLIKVAGIGLNSSHIGNTLAQMRPTLHRLEEKYGSHVCGEGGEFETLVLWMPGFHKRLVLDDFQIVHHSEDPYAPVSYMRVNSCRLEELTDEQRSTPMPLPPAVPQVFKSDPGTNEGCTILKTRDNDMQSAVLDVEDDDLNISVGSSRDYMLVSIQCAEDGGKGVEKAATHLKQVLKEQGESLGNVIYITLFLRSVSGPKYKEANNGYNSVFANPECTPPPSRACVAVSHENHATTMEALVRRGRDKDTPGAFAIHVQSLSEWAPPCIGPYSQFVEVDGVLHVSGILPLYPPTASVPEDLGAKAQVAACVYNLERTLEASHTSVENIGFVLAYTTPDCPIDIVQSELKWQLQQRKAQCTITAVVPISDLPKGGLVEIRAVGVLDEKSLSKPVVTWPQSNDACFGKVKVEHSVCGRLGYTVVHVSGAYWDRYEWVLEQVCLHAPVSKAPSIVSIQVYYAEGKSIKCVRNVLGEQLPGVATTLIKCMPGADFEGSVSVLTYDLLCRS